MRQPLLRAGRLAPLLGAALLNWSAGNGLFPLIPLYALEQGIAVEGVGMLLAAGFVALATGSLAAPRLSRLFGGYRRLYMAAALLQAGAYSRLGRASEGWEVLVFLVLAWLGAGLATTSLQVQSSLAAGARNRGRIFSLLALAPPLGALFGASALGGLATWGGYQLAFDAGALLALSAAAVLAPGRVSDQPDPIPLAPTGVLPSGAASALAEGGLLLAGLLGSTALFVGRLVTPVGMHALGFDPAATGTTAALGGLVTAPLVLLLGGLSDRLGRRRLLMGSYIAIAAAAGLLAGATHYWQFTLAAALLSLGFAASSSLSAALAADLLAPAALPAALGRLGATGWVAAVIAFGGGGFIIGRASLTNVCLIAAMLGLGALLPLAVTGWSTRMSYRPAPLGQSSPHDTLRHRS